MFYVSDTCNRQFLKPILTMKNLYAKSLALLFVVCTLLTNSTVAQTTIVSFGSTWKYFDQNSRPTDWEKSSFNDASWAAGAGQLGYGDGDEATVVSHGGCSPIATCGPKPMTTYFRKTISIANPSVYSNFTLNVKRDDGIVVWVNGSEVYSNNIGGARQHSTKATADASDDGNTVQTTTLATTSFSAGTNLIAVEIHQSDNTSSDISFDMELLGNPPGAATLTRGPYLQMGNQTGITIRWKTNTATNSRVTWGTTFGLYPNVVDDATVTTDHEVRVDGLTPDTKYFYTIGSSTQMLQGTNTNYVSTLPPTNTNRKLRFLALGDCGNASSNQTNVKNAALAYVGSNDIDAVLTIGDNAYSSGLETEFQTGFFDMYKNDLLKNKKLYTVPGNHDYGNTSANTGVRNNAYYNNFTMPTNAELGGTASGTEAYYSYDVGDVHFIALDSYGRENSNTLKLYDTTGAQCVWLKNDLAVNTRKWTVVYFHHPPYTKTSHNSDDPIADQDLILLRENFIRILERNGVDLVVNGHAHGYERSYLLKGYYKATPAAAQLMETDFNIATHTATGDDQNAEYDFIGNSCAYTYNSGKYNHGSVYIVAGSAGQLGGTRTGYPHNAMHYSNVTNGGSFYFEVDSNRLDAKFLSYDMVGSTAVPNVRDQFTIFKDVNKVTDLVINQNDPLELSASWRGTYNWATNGAATTQSVMPSTATTGTFDYVVTDAAAGSCLKDSFHVIVTFVAPVMLTQFNASLQKENVLLSWNTSQESNNQYFTIEKSTDGVNYHFLGKVNAAGTSTTANQYKLTDLQPTEGVNYYRLSQTDFDGHTKNLQVKTVNYKTTKDFSASIVHAGNGKVNLVFNNRIASGMSIRVSDIVGKEMMQQQFTAPVGAFTKTIQLPKGVYAVQLANTNLRVTEKIIIE